MQDNEGWWAKQAIRITKMWWNNMHISWEKRSCKNVWDWPKINFCVRCGALDLLKPKMACHWILTLVFLLDAQIQENPSLCKFHNLNFPDGC